MHSGRGSTRKPDCRWIPKRQCAGRKDPAKSDHRINVRCPVRTSRIGGLKEGSPVQLDPGMSIQPPSATLHPETKDCGLSESPQEVKEDERPLHAVVLLIDDTQQAVD